MGGKYRQLKHLNTLSDSGASKELIEECACRWVDHWSAVDGTPREVKEQLMGTHERNMFRQDQPYFKIDCAQHSAVGGTLFRVSP